MAMNISNCPRCGKIFAKGMRDLCPACIKEVDAEYERCVKFLRENKGATIKELSDAVDVTVKQITKFIREGRISLYNAPNLSYPCEICGVLIREGGMCDACRTRLANDVNKAKELTLQHRQEEQARRAAQTYRMNKND